MVMIISPGA